MSDDLPTIPAAFGQVQGRCPACGHAALFLGAGGYVTCGSLSCPRPDAASVLLEGSGAERDAALATLARVRKYAELMTDSVVVPVRGYGVDLVHMLDCDEEHATIAEQDACPGPAGAGSTQDGAQ